MPLLVVNKISVMTRLTRNGTRQNAVGKRRNSDAETALSSDENLGILSIQLSTAEQPINAEFESPMSYV